MTTNVLEEVRNHYAASGLTERLKAALTAFGPEDQRLSPQQLSALDHFHTRGVAATAELAELVGITADMSVLDVGSGLGGPARYLAASGVGGLSVDDPAWHDELRALGPWLSLDREPDLQISPVGGPAEGARAALSALSEVLSK